MARPAAGFDPGLIRSASAEACGWRAPRPRDAALTSGRGVLLSDVDSAIDRFLAETRVAAERKTPTPAPGLRDPVLTSLAV